MQRYERGKGENKWWKERDGEQDRVYLRHTHGKNFFVNWCQDV